MKTILALLALLSASSLRDFLLDWKTLEEQAQWRAMRDRLAGGDLTPVHEAYVQRDFKTLWMIYNAAMNSGIEMANAPTNDWGSGGK